MKPLILLLVALSLTANLHARLGDSPFWCYNKYGGKNNHRPKDDTRYASFSKDSLSVMCTFDKNAHCIAINYQRVPDGFTEAETEYFLSDNREGAIWEKTAGTGAKYWKRSDGGTAMLSGYTLFVKAPPSK